MQHHTAEDRPLTHKERLGFGAVVAALALVALLFAGCDHQTPTPRWETRHAAPVQPADARHSVFKIEASQANIDMTLTGWTGTAWIAGKVGTVTAPVTIVITAGHVCEPRTTYTLIDMDNHRHSGAYALVDDDVHDLCALAVPEALAGPVLPIAQHDPVYTAPSWYIGAPAGMWGGGLAGFYEAAFFGRGHPFGNSGPTPGIPSLAFSTFSGPGASGSPVLEGGYVVGVLNAVAARFESYMVAVPWDYVQVVLNQAIALGGTTPTPAA